MVASLSHISPAVVEESASSVSIRPSANVTGSITYFRNLVACVQQNKGACQRGGGVAMLRENVWWKGSVQDDDDDSVTDCLAARLSATRSVQLVLGLGTGSRSSQEHPFSTSTMVSNASDQVCGLHSIS